VMTIDWIDAPLLRGEVDLIEHGKRVISEISEIGGELPTYLNIGSLKLGQRWWMLLLTN